ncbi:MAG: translation initiation factor IF-2 [Candidatus Nanoarchaeia archaeon]
MTKIRQPIITMAGHVDHGKTSILDKIRGSSIAEQEAGNITQKISFTELPQDIIKQRANNVIQQFNIPLNIPGFLFIDTPGHAAFTNLRKRGGSLADLAVLVIDITEGIKPQTQEVLKILKQNQTPFIIALNKIDNLSGWKSNQFFYENINKQSLRVKQDFEEKTLTLIGSLHSYGFDADLYTNITDFTKKIAIIPCSAQTGEGIPEILAILSALSQKYLQEKISIGKQAKGVLLEVKKEKAIDHIEGILYDGQLTVGDKIAIASLQEGEETTITTQIKSIEKALPLNRGWQPCQIVEAAAGLRLQLKTKEPIMSGMPFQKLDNNLAEIEEKFKQQISQQVKTSDKGIVVKADSLGSLEALLTLLKENNIQVISAGIGPITKKDIYTANSLPEEDKAILGFNIPEEKAENIKIFTSPVIYKLIEDFQEWKQEKLKEIERRKLEDLPGIAKITILDFVFRNSNPAIFGVKINAGSLEQGAELIDADGKKIGRVKSIQAEQESLKKAEADKEVAISVPGINFDRQLEVGQELYTNLSAEQFRKFKSNKELLKQDEKSILTRIADIKRKQDVTWGL